MITIQQLITGGCVLCDLIFAAIALIFICCALIGIVRQGRAARLHQKFWRHAWERRAKAEIRQVGSIKRMPDGNVALDDWHFHLRSPIPRFCYGPDGQAVFYGYTVPELEEMARRPSEFET